MKELSDDWVEVKADFHGDSFKTKARTRRGNHNGLVVKSSLVTDREGTSWTRLVVSRTGSSPTLSDLKTVRDEYLGKNIDAYVLIPKQIDDIKIYPPQVSVFIPSEYEMVNHSNVSFEEGI